MVQLGVAKRSELGLKAQYPSFHFGQAGKSTDFPV